MTRNVIEIDASPEAVYAVLLDPRSYIDWVVGAARLREVDPEWPRAGSKFHHSVGVGPFMINDWSKIVEADGSRRLVLEVATRPLLVARVAIELQPRRTTTRLVMTEEPIAGPLLRLRRMVEPLLHIRNDRSLRRLKLLVERRRSRRAS